MMVIRPIKDTEPIRDTLGKTQETLVKAEGELLSTKDS